MSIAPQPDNIVAYTRNLTKIYGQGDHEVRAVDGIDLDLIRGSFTAIMGPSGSGKSTLMHCLAGLDDATSGEVWLAGTRLTGLGDRALTKIRREKVGFIFQQFNLLPMLTAHQNILLPLDLAGRTANKQHFDAIIESLNIGDRLHHRPSEMSGGQQQRVAVARALITMPDVVFADEPTGALDSKTGHNLLEYLARCSHDLGQTIVMVTHDANAASYAGRALMLSDGHIVRDMDNPTVDLILDAHKALDAGAAK